MNRLITFFVILFVILSFTGNVHANSSNQAPEKNGDYADIEHPGIRVRVFVHEPKSGRPSPTPTPTPTIVCPLDPDSSSVIPPTGWRLPTNWTYTLNPSSVPSSVGANNLATISGNSFNAWANSTSKINITNTGNTTSINKAQYDGKNIIAWGRTSGSALAITYTWYNQNTGLAVETDTIFNLKHPWFWSADNKCTDANSYDAQNILTHELGHWYGLDDTYTSSYVENTMYGYGSKGENKKNTLTIGDIEGIQAIYP